MVSPVVIQRSMNQKEGVGLCQPLERLRVEVHVQDVLALAPVYTA
jgi:hypothetical protein